MTVPYVTVDVPVDTPEWELERRNSLGASDIPNILNLPGAWGTPLEVYESKMGFDREFDEMRGFIGHALEGVMQLWLERYHPELGQIRPGFMARPPDKPWIHASFDRMTADGVPIQMKTVSFFISHEWDNGCPLNVQGQVQTEIMVAGSRGAWVVVFVAGADFRLIWVDRDQGFIDMMLPRAERFWTHNVLGRVMPEPMSPREAGVVWQSNGTPLVVTEPTVAERMWDVHGLWGTWQQETSAIDKLMDTTKLELQKAMQECDEIRVGGKVLFSWRADSKGRRKFLRHKVKESAE